jgi:acetyl-CoA C-acetyltransferase
MSEIDPRTPILIGGGQFTDRAAQKGQFTNEVAPIPMLERAARMAAADTGAAEGVIKAIDAIAIVRLIADSSESRRLPMGAITNPPRSLGKRLDVNAKREIYTAAGGNTPQQLVNHFAQEIAEGRTEMALLAGCENFATMMGAIKTGVALDWAEDAGGTPEEFGDYRRGSSDYEKAHGAWIPVNNYPLFENAIRGAKGRTVAEHQKKMGELFARYNAVAAANPLSWFPTKRSAEEIATPSPSNRYVGFPYTKYMNAVIEVDQAAAVFMTSVAKARELGVPEEKWVYLHGCAEATDIWLISERADYTKSPAIKLMGEKAFAMAGLTIADIGAMDLYSCFPSAVEYALDAFGLDQDDPRGFTVTGGLPYFGGAGNNYVMHSIVTMLETMRAQRGTYGLVTANGMYATKHACGIYSTIPTKPGWKREDPKSYQKQLDAMDRPNVVEVAEGDATIETYTVIHDRNGPMLGIVIGRLADGSRFLANTPPGDAAAMQTLMDTESLGRKGTVRHENGKNIFVAA